MKDHFWGHLTKRKKSYAKDSWLPMQLSTMRDYARKRACAARAFRQFFKTLAAPAAWPFLLSRARRNFPFTAAPGSRKP